MPDPAARRAPACPVCGKPRRADFEPFCSKRCADVDLGRWLTGGYAIPAAEEAPSDEERRGRDPEP